MFLLRRALGLPPKRQQAQPPAPHVHTEQDEFPDDPDTDLGDAEADGELSTS